MKVTFVDDGSTITIHEATFGNIDELSRLAKMFKLISESTGQPVIFGNLKPTSDVIPDAVNSASKIVKQTKSNSVKLTVMQLEKELGLSKDRLRHYYLKGYLKTIRVNNIHCVEDSLAACKQIIKHTKSEDLIDTCKKYIKEHTVQPSDSRCQFDIPEGYVKMTEYAKQLNKSPATLRYHIDIGLDGKKINNAWYVKPELVDEWLKKHNLSSVAKANLKKAQSVRKANVAKSKIKPMRLEPVDYATWRADIYVKIRQSNLEPGDVLSKAYKLTTSKYGVQWDKFREIYITQKGVRPDKTIQVAYFLDNEYDYSYHNIFSSVVDTVIKQELVSGGKHACTK